MEINPKRNSPYSRFGLGDLQDQYLVAPAAMGGLSAAFQDPFQLNVRNPASLAFLKATAFEVGLYARYALIDDKQDQTNNWSGNLDYLALGFPLKNPINEALDRQESKVGIGMAFSLQPYTVVGYDILAELNGDGAGQTTNSYKGTGGTYRLGWGNAVRWKGLALGVNINYLFGKLTTNSRADFLDLESDYSTEILNETNVNGLSADLGLQYVYEFTKLNDKKERIPSGKRIIIGAFGKSANSFSTNSSRFIFRENATYRDIDTVLFNDNLRGKGTLPAQFSAGLVFENINHFRLGMEYSYGAWSGYQNEAKPEALTDSWGVNLGAEFIPNYASYNNFFERVRYRFGVLYRTDPRTFAAGTPRQYALTLGMGMPIVRPREQVSFLNLALEVGQFGHPDIIQETYVRLALGFTLNDNTWFFKRKFN